MKLFITLPLVAFAALVISTPVELGNQLEASKVENALEARHPQQTGVVCKCRKVLGVRYFLKKIFILLANIITNY